MVQKLENSLLAEFNAEVEKTKNFAKTDIILNKANKFAEHKPFWDKFLSEPMPEGQINKTLEKNFALWVVLNEVPIEQIQAAYEAHHWNFGALKGYFKMIQEGRLTEYNPAEIMVWAKEFRTDLMPLLYSVPTEQSESALPKELQYNLLWDNELPTYKEKTYSWNINKLIRSGTITVLAGKRSTLKSWLCLDMGYCVAQGRKFLNTFDCERGNVMYLDRENGFSQLKVRDAMIRKALELSNDKQGILFIAETDVKIDRNVDLNEIERLVKLHDIKMLFIDTYRRVIRFDEDKAQEVSKLFVDMLKPLCERTGLSIVLIHHEKKGQSAGDDMDMLRGSSDLANYVDGIIQIERKGNLITVKQTKSRTGKELEPFQVGVETDETSFFKFVYKGVAETQETRISKGIVEWIMKDGLNEFSYSQARDYAEMQSWPKTNFEAALKSLVRDGILSRGNGKRDPYVVKEINLGGFAE